MDNKQLTAINPELPREIREYRHYRKQLSRCCYHANRSAYLFNQRASSQISRSIREMLSTQTKETKQAVRELMQLI